MSILFDLPAGLQVTILSSWLGLPNNSPRTADTTLLFDKAVNNKSFRHQLTELYATLNWEHFFDFTDVDITMRRLDWAIGRRFRFTHFTLRSRAIDPRVLGRFIAQNGNSLRSAKLVDIHESEAAMEHIARHCTSLETLYWDRSDIPSSLATVLEKNSTTLRELRIGTPGFSNKPSDYDYTATLETKAGVFAHVFCPNVAIFTMFEYMNLSELAAAMDAFPNVIRLKIGGTVYSKGVLALLHAWSKLEELSLFCNMDLDRTMCAALGQSAPTLRKLTLGSVSDVDLHALRTLLAQCTSLHSITVSYKLPSSTVKIIAETCGSRLSHLHLPATTRVTPEAAESISQHCTNLRTLVAPMLAQWTAHELIFEKCVLLETLHVKFDAAYSTQCSSFMQSIIKHCKNLQCLNLIGNCVVPDFYEELALIVEKNTKLCTVGSGVWQCAKDRVKCPIMVGRSIAYMSDRECTRLVDTRYD